MNNLPSTTVFSTEASFITGQRMAKCLAESHLVPEAYRGKLADCVIALELAQRLGASPLAVMQATHIIHGRPSFSAQFIIGMVNSCGRYSPLRFAMSGEGDKRSCIAWAYELASGDRLEGPAVSIAMAKAEKWFDKTGSKWRTMPELMLRYRAATFFGRLYAPELMMGMRTDDEIQDMGAERIEPEAVKKLNERFNKAEVVEAAIEEIKDPQPEKTVAEVDMEIFEAEVTELNKLTDPGLVEGWKEKHSDRILDQYPSATAVAILDHADMVQKILLREMEEVEE